MSDIALFKFQCTVCNRIFFSYTECKITRRFDNVLEIFVAFVESPFGNFDTEKLFFREANSNPLVDNLPIKGERKCQYCRKFIQLDKWVVE